MSHKIHFGFTSKATFSLSNSNLFPIRISMLLSCGAVP
jgi:hypothetical protein